jgi:hypothetical protein
LWIFALLWGLVRNRWNMKKLRRGFTGNALH